MDRPYLQRGIAELQQLFASHRNDAAVLQKLVEESAHRKTSTARALMTKILSRIGEIEDGSDTNETAISAFQGQDEEQPLSSENQVPHEAAKEVQRLRGTSGLTRPRTPRSYELFGSETEVYGPIPDDRKRPDQLTLTRPPGTRGLPDPYVRPLKREHPQPNARRCGSREAALARKA
jgi:hypothetical protein